MNKKTNVMLEIVHDLFTLAQSQNRKNKAEAINLSPNKRFKFCSKWIYKLRLQTQFTWSPLRFFFSPWSCKNMCRIAKKKATQKSPELIGPLPKSKWLFIGDLMSKNAHNKNTDKSCGQERTKKKYEIINWLGDRFRWRWNRLLKQINNKHETFFHCTQTH